MNINNNYDSRRGAFTAEIDGSEAGEMTYVFTNDKVFIINHTNVEPAYEGEGVGTKMVLAAVDFARDSGYKLMATCPFARSVLVKRADDVRDVVYG